MNLGLGLLLIGAAMLMTITFSAIDSTTEAQMMIFIIAIYGAGLIARGDK